MDKKFDQSDFMSLQLMEIENFRLSLSEQSEEKVTLQEALVLWISEGYADDFKSDYFLLRKNIEPAIA